MAVIQIEDDIKDFVTKYADLALYLDKCLINRDFFHAMTFEWLHQRFINSTFCTRYNDCNEVMWELKQKIHKCTRWQDAWYEFCQSPIRATKDSLLIPIKGSSDVYSFDAEFETHQLMFIFCPNEVNILHCEVPYLTSTDPDFQRFFQFQNNKDLFSVLYAYDVNCKENLHTCCFRSKPDLKFQSALLFGVRDKNIIPCPYTNDAIKLLVKKC